MEILVKTSQQAQTLHRRRGLYSSYGPIARVGFRIALTAVVGYLTVGAVLLSQARSESDWPPIPPEELALRDDHLNPGAHAVILYREVYADHVDHSETHHVRIKVLTEQGRAYGNVMIPSSPNTVVAEDIEARTVDSDGRAVPFSGQVLQSTLARNRDVKVFVKVLSLPDVAVGTIVEYRYKLYWKTNGLSKFLYHYSWDIQSDLSLLWGRFIISPMITMNLTESRKRL